MAGFRQKLVESSVNLQLLRYRRMEKILILIRITLGMQIWETIALTTRLITSIKVIISQTSRFKLKKIF